MKKRINSILSKCTTLVASLAMIVAVSTVSSTCVLLAYQPDLPEELK